MRRGHREAGNATALALLATLLISGIAAGIASVSFRVNKTGEGLNSAVFATYAAEAGMEEARVLISAGVTADPIVSNTWLADHAIAYDVDRKDFPDLEVDIPALEDIGLGESGVPKNHRADLWVYAMDDIGWNFRVVSRAVTGNVRPRPGSTQAWDVVGDVAVTLAQDVKTRELLTKYATFAASGTLRFGRTTVSGDVHSNGNIEFHFGGAQFLDRVTAVNGFKFLNGATQSTTTFNQANPAVKPIELPTIGDVSEFSQFASGPYNVAGDARIQLLGDEVQITVLEPGTQNVLSEGTHPLPPDGVLYVQGNVTSIQGALSGRMTLSTAGTINVTGNILYTDFQGDSAMRLEKDGEPVDPAGLPSGTAWLKEDGYKYAENPDFDLEGAERPALGLMAGGQITLDGSGPENLELHASLFSATSNWAADLGAEKGNLRILGSITTNTPGARAQGGNGYALSGEYIYDRALLENPPPRWLTVDAISWGPRWRIGW